VYCFLDLLPPSKDLVLRCREAGRFDFPVFVLTDEFMYYYTKTSLRVTPHLGIVYVSWDPRFPGTPVIICTFVLFGRRSR
jgi:hypothetical protein